MEYIIEAKNSSARIRRFKLPTGIEQKELSEVEYMYYEYPSSRDIVFVFGAGTSYSEGVPLQSQIIPYIIKEDDGHMKSSYAYNCVYPFIMTFFKPDMILNKYPSLEQIYSYLEYHISNGFGLNSHYNVEKLKLVMENMGYLIHYIIDKRKDDLFSFERNHDDVYSVFWKKVCDINKNISVISLNYDTLLEERFDYLYLKEALIDYRIDFMNYDSGINVGSDWWIDPRYPVSFPLFGDYSEYQATPIKVIKPHGSLNWRYCTCCNRVFLSHWNNAVDLNELDFVKDDNSEDESDLCPYDFSKYSKLIIPPTHFKKFTNSTISKLFAESIIELRSAKKICFIGYSFPEADVHIKAIIDKVDVSDKEIFCINPYCDDTLKYNYHLIKSEIKFIDMTFKEFLESSEFENLLSIKD